MRICHYTETALPKLGGQEFAVDALLRHQAALGHDVVLLAQRPRRRYRVEDDRLPYPVVRHPRMLSTHRLVGLYRHWLLKTHRRYRFDVLHCHSVYPCGYLAALCRDLLGVPVVITSHGGDIHEGNCRLAKRGIVERVQRALGSSDAQIAISDFTATAFQRLHPGRPRIERIPNGVDVTPFSQHVSRPATIASELRASRYVLFLGRLHHRKGVDVLVAAMQQVCREQPDAQLAIAGDGPERETLMEQVANLGLSQNVVFTGAVGGDTKTWLLQNARCVAMPSRQWEAFPLVLLEAFAAGQPVIASDLPGLADLVRSGKTGFVVPIEQPRVLAAAILKLFRDEALASGMSSAARTLANEYRWEAVAARLVALYQNLAADRRAAA